MTYRAGLLRCPGCGEALAPVAHGTETLDVCPACAGVWVDWFDGPLHDVARAMDGHRGVGGAQPTPLHACPRCTVALVLELAGEGGAPGGSGGMGEPWVERCGDCGGAFIPKEAVGLFVAARPPMDLPEGTRAAPLWVRISRALRSLLGA